MTDAPKPAAASADLQRLAQTLATDFATAEAALEKLSRSMALFTRAAPGMGPITRAAFNKRAVGIEGDILQLHLDITPHDPRPRPRDGNGK